MGKEKNKEKKVKKKISNQIMNINALIMMGDERRKKKK